MTRYLRAVQFAFALAALVMASAGMAQRAGLVAEATPHAVGWEAPADDRTVVALARVRGHEVPVYRIGELRAPDTPTGMDGFAVRVAYVLRGWTREHGVEAIGNLCRTPDGGEWGTTLLTAGAHVASPVTSACPAGMLATGVDIHSHPQRQHYRVNAVDEIFVGRVLDGAVVTRPDILGPDDCGHRATWWAASACTISTAWIGCAWCATCACRHRSTQPVTCGGWPAWESPCG